MKKKKHLRSKIQELISSEELYELCSFKTQLEAKERRRKRFENRNKRHRKGEQE